MYPQAAVAGAIDIVVNAFTPVEVSERKNMDPSFYEKVRVAPLHRDGVPIDAYLAMMDEARIDVSFLIAVKAGDPLHTMSYQLDIDRVASYCAKAPRRLFGLAGIDGSNIMHSLRDIERAVTEYGFVGAHLYPHWFGWPPDDARFYPFYAKCCELDIPVMMQVGHCLDYKQGYVRPSVGRPITLDKIAIDFPELKLIGIHLGWPWTEEMIAVAYKHQNVYMCADAYAPKHWPKEYIHFANTFGQDKCMFGTDWPVVHPGRAMEELAGLGLRQEPRRKFLRENALRVFKLNDRVTEPVVPSAGRE